MEERADIRVIDVTDGSAFALLPPCADARLDHRSCDYWENEAGGSKASRPRWWQDRPATAATPGPRPASDNPFASTPSEAAEHNPFSAASAGAAPGSNAGDGSLDAVPFNPFAPAPQPDHATTSSAPRKLRLLARGARVFGSYAKVLLVDENPAGYAQFGPLSAYPRAQGIRQLYRKLPQSPLPAVITCIATTAEARGQGLAVRLIEAICEDLSGLGFSAAEAYPDLTLGADEASAADPRFWQGCGFAVVASDERYPVMRRELD